MGRRFDVLDGWRTLAIALMTVYHFLYDLALFGVISWQQLFSPALNVMQKFTCGSFILLAGASARFSRSNLRRGIIVLAAGIAVELGAMVGGQIIHFGILHFMGVSMVLYHFLGRYLQKCPPAVLLAASAVLYGLTGWWTSVTTVSVGWLYPLGLPWIPQRGLLSPAALVLPLSGGDRAGGLVPGPPGQPGPHPDPARGAHVAGAAQPAHLPAPPADSLRRELSHLGVTLTCAANATAP